MLELDHANYNAGEDAKKQGSISTLGRGMTAPPAWKDAGCVHSNLEGVMMPDVKSRPPANTGTGASLFYNEYIVYDVAQIRQRYLFHVQMS